MTAYLLFTLQSVDYSKRFVKGIIKLKSEENGNNAGLSKRTNTRDGKFLYCFVCWERHCRNTVERRYNWPRFKIENNDAVGRYYKGNFTWYLWQRNTCYILLDLLVRCGYLVTGVY